MPSQQYELDRLIKGYFHDRASNSLHLHSSLMWFMVTGVLCFVLYIRILQNSSIFTIFVRQLNRSDEADFLTPIELALAQE